MARKKQSRRIRTNEKSAPYPYDEKVEIQLPPEIEQEIRNLVSGCEWIQSCGSIHIE